MPLSHDQEWRLKPVDAVANKFRQNRTNRLAVLKAITILATAEIQKRANAGSLWTRSKLIAEIKSIVSTCPAKDYSQHLRSVDVLLEQLDCTALPAGVSPVINVTFSDTSSSSVSSLSSTYSFSSLGDYPDFFSLPLASQQQQHQPTTNTLPSHSQSSSVHPLQLHESQVQPSLTYTSWIDCLPSDAALAPSFVSSGIDDPNDFRWFDNYAVARFRKR
jgi:hypothetical protein